MCILSSVTDGYLTLFRKELTTFPNKSYIFIDHKITTAAAASNSLVEFSG